MRRVILADPPEPPPSPVPTGKGARSAANEPFSRFLDRSLRVPALSMPSASSPVGRDHHAPATADLSLLLSGEDNGLLERVLGSVRDFGVFRATGHGFSAAEMGGLVGECVDQGGTYWRGVHEGLGEKLRLLSVRSRSEISGLGPVLEPQDRRYRSQSENMKSIASKLEGIGEKLTDILLQNSRKEGIDDHKAANSGDNKEALLSLYRFNHKNSIEKNQLPLNEEIEDATTDRICLVLHVFFERCQLYVQSEEDHFSFDADSETLIVTVGKQIQEWSGQEFKSVTGKMIFVPSPDIRATCDHSFAVELKLSSAYLSINRNATISIFDQIVFATIFALFYKIYQFLSSV